MVGSRSSQGKYAWKSLWEEYSHGYYFLKNVRYIIYLLFSYHLSQLWLETQNLVAGRKMTIFGNQRQT